MDFGTSTFIHLKKQLKNDLDFFERQIASLHRNSGQYSPDFGAGLKCAYEIAASRIARLDKTLDFLEEDLEDLAGKYVGH